MNGVNKVILVGYVGSDPQCNQGRNGGGMVTTMQIATTQRWKDQQGQDQSKTEWHNLVFFKRLAEVAGDYVKKGDPLYVEGSLQTDKYTDKNGIEKYTTKVIVSQMQMLGSKDSDNNGGGNNQSRNNNNNRGSNQNQSRQQNNNNNQSRNNSQNSNNQRTQYSQSRDGAPDDLPYDDIPF